MAEVKALVSELLLLLISDTDLSKICKPSSPSRSGSSSPSPNAPINNPYAALNKHDLWSHLDSLLFPYMSYNMKVLMAPPPTSRGTVIKKNSTNNPSLLDAFVKANITSEAASLYSFDHLLPVAIYEACTKELLDLAALEGALLSEEAASILDLSRASGNHLTLSSSAASSDLATSTAPAAAATPAELPAAAAGAATPEKRKRAPIYSLPGLGVINNNVDLDDNVSSLIHHVIHHHMTHVTVNFRRITRSRLQARCTVPALPALLLPRKKPAGRRAFSSPAKPDSDAASTPPLDPGTSFDFIWESSAIDGIHNWKLRRFGFADSDDEEHYWRPWELSLQDAEADYDIFQQHDYKADLAPLDVSDIDWDSLTSATTPTDDTMDTLSSSTHSLTLHEPLSSLPAINNCNVPSKNPPTNGVYYSTLPDSLSSASTTSSSKHSGASNGKYLGKTIGHPAQPAASSSLYSSAFNFHSNSAAAAATHSGRPLVLGSSTNTAHHYNPLSALHNHPSTNPHLPLQQTAAPAYHHAWGHDDHHNHYESLEIDYEDDYSYKQSHPVFQHPIASYDVYDDDDDIFGVCHSMPAAAPKPVPAAAPVPAAKAPAIAAGDSSATLSAATGTISAQSGAAAASTAAAKPGLTVQTSGLFGSSATPTLAPVVAVSAYQQPANATATKTQPTPQPLLQRVCDGDDDDEAAYWDRYDDFV